MSLDSDWGESVIKKLLRRTTMKKGLRNMFHRVVKFARRCLGGGRRRRGLERPTVTSDSSQEQKQLPQTGLLKPEDKQWTKNHQAFKENQHHGRQAPEAMSTSVNAQGNSY